MHCHKPQTKYTMIFHIFAYSGPWFNMIHMKISDYPETYEVYVTDSLLNTLPNDHLCGTFYTTTQGRIWKHVKCSNQRVFTGNTVILRKITNYGRLIVNEVQIFSKLKRTAVVKIAF